MKGLWQFHCLSMENRLKAVIPRAFNMCRYSAAQKGLLDR